jgi:hypothetical protein
MGGQETEEEDLAERKEAELKYTLSNCILARSMLTII